MRLLCDEDFGAGVPTALSAIGYDARSLAQMGWRGQPDVAWLARAGDLGMLVLSCNEKMLLVPRARRTIISARVGIVFLTTGEERPERVLLTLIRKWDALETLDSTERRPFAKFILHNGRISDSYRGPKL